MPEFTPAAAAQAHAAIESTSTKDEHWSAVHRRMLAVKGFYLKPGARVLDFGCGDGALVYEYLDAGFDAYGFEIRPLAKLRNPEDAPRFLYSLAGQNSPSGDFHIDRSTFRIPCDDALFDFMCSMSVLEHVLDLDTVLAECARVLKPGGVAIHVFPARYMRREPHMYVPFGGFIQNYSWFLLWAALGIRAEWQQGSGTLETARSNRDYARKYINYLRLDTILSIARRHFSGVEIDPRLWELRVPGRSSFWAALLHAPLIHGMANWWYQRFCTLVLFLVK